MEKSICLRVQEEAKYIMDSKENIRATANHFHISKSTVHKDMQERLQKISPEMYQEVKKILKDHLKTRHIKGGEATKEKYRKK